ncbi:MAG: hypothetical protein RI907_3476 [Pseudomonadota bacterium]|jgi:hypothetical protein
MLNALIRFGMGLIGLAMLLEVFLPQVHETATVDQHTISTRRDHHRDPSTTETSYKLRFLGSKIESCDVGWRAYNDTQDGDVIDVRYTKLFKHCTAIDKNGAQLYDNQGWRLFSAFTGVIALLAAFGAFPSFNFEGRQVY